MHTQRRRALLSWAALVALSSILASGATAAERIGTPRIYLDRSHDRPEAEGGLHATSAADTTILASWTFGTSACSDEGWTSTDLTAGGTGFGNYAGVLPGSTLYSSELCIDDIGCLWAFVSGSNDTYSCGGHAGEAAVPYGDPQRGYIWNEIQSPPINLTGIGSAFGLRFSVYRALPFHDLVFYTWRVRSLHAGVAGEWRSRNNVYYGPMVTRADWMIQEESIGALIEPGADQIQIALGVIDMAGVWGGLLGDGACHTNAPFFDTVKVYRASGGGPQWNVECADLFQDNFPGDGTATGTVRMDMARDINPREITSIYPGDSLVVRVSEPTAGLDFHTPGMPASGPAVYLHVKDVSPAKSGAAISGDLARWPVAATGGGWTTLRFDTVRTPAGTLADRYCVDLNDALYTPGDVVEFYFSARDSQERVTYWTEFFGPTASASDAQTADMEATCLPKPGRDDYAILYIDDMDGTGGQAYFDGAFLTLGIQSRVDRYDVRSPDGLVGNGPGSRVTNVHNQLAAFYDTIIWASGNRTAGLIGDGSGAPEKSPDAAMLVAFLEEKVPAGALYLNGDHIAAELKQLRSPSALALQNYIQFDVLSEAHSPPLALSPQVSSTPGSTFTHNGIADHFFLFGGCPQLNSFGVLAASGPSIVETVYGGSNSGAEVSQWTSGTWVVLSGFGFEFMRDDELDGVSDRALHLHDILASSEFPGFCFYDGSIVAEPTGARISWDVGGCRDDMRGVRIYRRLETEPVVSVIHETTVPPFTGELHDQIPIGQRAKYTIMATLTHAREALIDSATVSRSASIAAFRAQARDLGIDITWNLSDRSGIASLTVEKRRRGASTFTAAGDDSLLSPDATRFFDRQFEPGARYEYRLSIRYQGGLKVTGDIASAEAPHAVALGQNIPNPFNPETRIPFMLPSAGNVEVAIFDVNGARVRTLLNGQRNAGYSEVRWDGMNEDGSSAASGVYFCRLSAPGQILTRKIVLVR